MSDDKTFHVRVFVRLRPDILDPQGRAVGQALERLGFDGLASVRAGKTFDLELAAPDGEAAAGRAEEMAAKLLANPITEDFEVVLVDGGEG